MTRRSSRRAGAPAAFLLALALAACPPATAQQRAPAAPAPGGIGFELAVPREQVFQRVVAAFVQHGLPIAEASAESGVVRSRPFDSGAATRSMVTVTVGGTERMARVSLRGWFSAADLGLTGEPIIEAEYGLRARLWSHLSSLARTIETRPAAVTVNMDTARVPVPDVDVRTPPD